ncbi:hemagglutinin repeat-containing protein, partial [Pseudomonas sp. NFPP19]|uniref:hemagglutinin repeat-containing protein n=1 Tax=Pseudomonas sp. NFPP19 TaxID=1566225 RepID=UPI0008D05A06
RNANGDISLNARDLDNRGKSIVASRDLTLNTAQILDNRGGTLSGQRQVKVSAGALDNSHQGKLLSAERLQLDVEQVRNGQGGLIKSQQSLNANLGHLSNSGGELSSQGSSTLVLAGMDNLTGVVLAQQTLEITGTAELDNQGGLLSGWQGLTLNGTGLNNSNKGTVSSLKGGVEVTLSDALNNSQGGGLVSQQALDVKAASLDNSHQGVISSAGEQSLKLSDLLDNSQGGSIDSAATLTLQAMTLGNNGGTLDAAGDLTFTGTDLDNGTGTFTGKTAVTLNLLGALNNTHGKLASGGPLRIERAGQIDNRGGQMASQGLLSLFAASLDNRNRGTLMANDPLTLTLDGVLQNSGDGLIYSQTGGLHVQAGSLTNGKGTLQSQGALNLSTGDIDNQSGRILARNGNLNIGAGHLDNRGGVLSSVQGAMIADLRGVLKNGYDPSNNRQGGVTQAQRLTLKALAGIDNDGGRISAQSGDALITTGDFDNRNGGLYAKGLVKVSGGHFDNSGNNGQIAGQQINFDLSGALNNHKGIIESDSSLTIKAASLDNQTGQLRALGDGGDTRLELGGLFDNRDGSLETANQNLAFDAGSFNNRGGSVLHSGNGLFGLSMANLEDVGGRLKTAGQLILEGERWTNSSSIQAGKLTVNVNHLTQARTGQLLAGNGLIGSGVNWINDGLIGSDAGVNIDLSGHYSSKGRLSSFGQLDLKAAQVDLADSASIAGGGNTTVSVFGQLNNAGRLSAAAGLTLNASGINNQGTLGAAQNLTLTTGGLLNDHGLVFSGDDMGLRVDTLTNSYGNVYSLGHLTIDRDGQGALASRIANRSGTLQSDGSMTLAASTLENMRDVLATNNGGIYTARIGEVACIEGYNAGDCGGKRNHVWEIVQRDKFEVTEASAASSIAAGVNLNINAGDLLNQSSSISAAGNLVATVNNLTHSGVETGETETTRVFMSARTKNASAWYNVANAVTNRYWFQSAGYTPDDLGGLEGALAGFIGMTEREWVGLGTTKKLAGGDQSYAAVIQAGGAVSIKAGNGFDSSVVRPGYTYVGSGARTDTQVPDTAFATRISLSPQLPPDLTQQQVNPLALPGFSLPAGQNGLFRLSGQSSSATPAPAQIAGLPDAANLTRPHKYLIETNPVLTDLKQFMSSDYLLSSLGYNPDDSAKRLGDGFYEQKLIQQAVQARTGQRFIDGQNSDEQLFKYLMDNAIQSRQQLNLSVGVALTSEQVAALTHDIVWLESHEVNGEQVLVPVLYLAQAKNRLAPNGALIAGNDVNLIAGQDLNNVGTLRATNNLSAQAGQNLINSGLVEAGSRLDLLAGNDLVNKAGGIIAGRDVSLAATRGDVINERTLTSHQSSNGSYAQQRDFVDNAARVEAANSLVISAGRDINNDGGVLKSGADIGLKAGRDINLTSVQQVVSNDRGVRYNDLSVTQNGSSLQAGRDLAISAGRDITAIASQIEAKRDVAMTATENLSLVSAASEQHAYSKTKKVTSQEDHVQQVGTTLVAGGNVALKAGEDLALTASRVTAGDEAYLYAGGDVNLSAGQNSDYSYYRKTKTSSSGLSSSQKTRIDSSNSITQQGSSVSGDTVVIRAGQDIGATASDIVSTHSTSLVAGRNVEIDSANETYEQSHSTSEKKSGLLSSGGIGFTLGSTSAQNTSSSTTENAKASTIGSVLGNVDIQAGKDLTLKGSDVIAGKDISLVGQNVSILAAENHNKSEQTSKTKTSGLTLALSGTVGSAVDAAYQTTKQAREEDDSRLSALQGIKAGLTGVQAWQAAQQGGGMNGDNIGQFVGISISLGSQQSSSKQTQEQLVSQGSSLTSGNNLSIVAAGSGTAGADGDIRVQGSQLKAGNNVLLAAERDIQLEAAANRQKLDGKNSSSGGAIGVSLGVGPNGAGLSIFANGNKGVGKEKGTGTTWTETTLDAGNQASLISGRDAVLKGAQVNADKITAKVGRDLTLQSLQDTDDYKSKQSNVSGGASFTFGTMTGSASVSVSQSKIDSKYQSVQEQTGLFAGKGGYQVEVGKHTQLDGSVIASTAETDKNRLSTGTLGWSDLKNEAEYKSQMQSASVSSGNGGADGFTSNMPSGMLIAYNHGGSASGTTSSAISNGTLDIRDPGQQKQDVATLSRDVEHANGSISPIFDKEKEQKRLREVQLIGEIGTQVTDIVRTEGQLKADQEASKELEEKGIYRPGSNASKEEVEKYQTKLIATDAYQQIMGKYGTGGDYQRVAQAVTAALQGLAGGDIGSALAGASAPYLAQLIKKSTGDNPALNTMAHAVLGAAVAQAQGNSAIAGAAGAAGGELAARLITQQLYGTSDTSSLSEEQKQTVAALSTLAAGLAGGIAKGDSAGAIAGAGAGKNAVENNHLGTGVNIFGHQLGKDQVAEFGNELKASCGDSGGLQACLKTYDTWKETSYRQGGLETKEAQAGWEEFVEAVYTEKVLPLCKGNAACERNVATHMAVTTVTYAGDSVGIGQAIGEATRAVNLANGNWVRLGFQAVEDASFLTTFSSMLGIAGKGGGTDGLLTSEKVLGGAGGNWKVINEVVVPSVVKQVNSLSCGQACVEMMLGDRKINASQNVISKLAGDGATYETQLASVLNKLDSSGSRKWVGSGVDADDIGTFHGLSSTGAWAAQLWERGSKIGHWVVVDGLDSGGRVMIRDPWKGTSYKMDMKEFQGTWNGYSIWGQ